MTVNRRRRSENPAEKGDGHPRFQRVGECAWAFRYPAIAERSATNAATPQRTGKHYGSASVYLSPFRPPPRP